MKVPFLYFLFSWKMPTKFSCKCKAKQIEEKLLQKGMISLEQVHKMIEGISIKMLKIL